MRYGATRSEHWRPIRCYLVSIGLLTTPCLVGCGLADTSGDGGTETGDAGDAGSGVIADIPWLDVGLPPLGVTPCADGWREVMDEGGVATCDPYPEGGPLDCPAGSAHFPGEAGCAPVGVPCPAGDFAEDLPADRRVVYVRPGAVGGDGSAAAPYGGPTDFSLGSLPVGTVIALSKGAHDGPWRAAREHVLRGACAEATTLRAAEPSETEAVVTMVGAGGEVRDLTIVDSPRRGVMLDGPGIEGRLDGVVVAAMEGVALMVQFGSSLSAQTLVVSDTAGRSRDGSFGRGLNVQSGATADVDRAVFAGNRDVAVRANGPDTTMTLADFVVRDTQSRASDGRFGRGLNVDGGATADVVRALFERNRSSSVLVLDPGATLTLADAVVRDTRGQTSGEEFGRGLSASLGATVAVSRALFDHNRDAALFVDGRGASVLLEGVVVRNTESQASDDGFGRGLNVQGGATAEVAGALFEQNREVGVHASGDGSALTLADVVVRNTESQASDGHRGRGINLQSGAMAEARRALLSGNRELGLAAQSAAQALAEDVVISSTAPRACVETTCADAGAGHGVSSHAAGTAVRLTRFLVRDSTLCGVLVSDGGGLDLSDGEVSGNAIGACVQVDGHDSARLTTDVRYTDNGVNLQATTLPVPEPAAPAVGSP